MMNRIKIKILDDSHYVLRRLYSKGINVYKIDKNNIYTVDYKDLDNIPFDIDIVSFIGIKRYIYYIKKHKHFIISTIISIVMMFILSNIIVSVEVIHNDKKIREIIIDELYNNGIHPFIFKKNYDELQVIKEHIKDKYKENIEWLEIIDEGMKYTIKVEERIITKKEDKPLYCDIISTKDAVVLTSQVSYGQEVVSYNDFVKKGSTLVSGKITFNEETKSYVCAEASIYGNTWYTTNVSIPYEYELKDYTGKLSKNISFVFGSKRNQLLKVHFQNYDVIQKELFKIGRLSIYSETNKEYNVKKEKYSKEEALKKAINLAHEKMKINLPSSATIIDEKVLQTNFYDSIIEVDIFYSVKEIISKQVERDRE